MFNTNDPSGIGVRVGVGVIVTEGVGVVPMVDVIDGVILIVGVIDGVILIDGVTLGVTDGVGDCVMFIHSHTSHPLLSTAFIQYSGEFSKAVGKVKI